MILSNSENGYNDICTMTSGSVAETVFGKVIIDSTISNKNIVYEWIIKFIKIEILCGSIGICEIDKDYTKCSFLNKAKKASIYGYYAGDARFGELNDDGIRGFKPKDTIKVQFNVNTLELKFYKNNVLRAIIKNINSEKKYHMAVYLSGDGQIQLMDFSIKKVTETK